MQPLKMTAYIILFTCSFSFAVAQAKVAPPLAGKSYSGIVVFGDSLSDASATGALKSGNNVAVITSEKYYDSSTKKPMVLNTSTGAPITNKGYNATALLWDNDLLKLLQQKGIVQNNTLLMPAFSPVEKASNANVSYAFASAETGDNYLNDISGASYPPYEKNCTKPGYDANTKENCVPGALKQIDLYLSDPKNTPNLTSRLYFIFAGGNDIFNDISKGKDFSEWSNFDDNLVKAVKELNAKGISADHIILFAVPEIAKAPAASVFLSGNKLVEGLFNDLIATTNLGIKQRIKGKATWYDPAAFFKLATKGDYKFTDPIQPSQSYVIHYLGGANKQADEHYYTQDCASMDPTNDAAQNTACKNASNSYDAFFNDKHPTAVTHLAFAADIYHKLFGT